MQPRPKDTVPHCAANFRSEGLVLATYGAGILMCLTNHANDLFTVVALETKTISNHVIRVHGCVKKRREITIIKVQCAVGEYVCEIPCCETLKFLNSNNSNDLNVVYLMHAWNPCTA